MTYFQYERSPHPIRAGLSESYRQYWHSLALPGTWFTGVERVAIAAEVRNALICPHCAQRKLALSPNSVKGQHLSAGALSENVVDVVHRVIMDQSRITQTYVNENSAAGLSEEQYIELVGIAVTVFSIDEFNRGMGLDTEPLPEPASGEPSLYRPKQAEHGTGFVAMVPPDGANGEESDLWHNGKTANVLRALTLVPNAYREWTAVAAEQYLSMQAMVQFGDLPGRSINRMQTELVAGRVSSINECFY
ncbi:MAG: hypothetical protein ACJAUG_000069 [Halioglobus sp.]|jgi:hypothetical protein